MDTIFMSSGNKKTSDPHRLLLHLVGRSNWKTIYLTYQPPHGVKNVLYLMYHIRYRYLRLFWALWKYMKRLLIKSFNTKIYQQNWEQKYI